MCYNALMKIENPEVLKSELKYNLPERQEDIIQKMIQQEFALGPVAKKSFIDATLSKMLVLKGIDDPIQARRKIFDIVAESIDDLNKIGVKFNFIGFSEENLERIKRTAIGIGNHTISGIEAFYVHAMNPVNTRVVVKESLINAPVVGSAFATTDPIIVKRDKNNEVANEREVAKDIVRTLNEKSEEGVYKNRVYMFPEGSRSQDGGLLPFKGLALLIKMAKKRGDVEIPVITTDSYSVLNFTSEPHKILQGRMFKGEVRFYLDFVNIKDRDIKDIEEEIRQTMLQRLDESLKQRETELGIST